MKPTFIAIKPENALSRKVIRALDQLREGANVLTAARSTMATMMEGDGSDEAHFTMLVSSGAYPTSADAKASWDELKRLTETGYEAIAAIMQACAKHGV